MTPQIIGGTNISDQTTRMALLQHKLVNEVTPLVVRFTVDILESFTQTYDAYKLQSFIVSDIFRAVRKLYDTHKIVEPTDTHAFMVPHISFPNECLSVFLDWYTRHSQTICDWFPYSKAGSTKGYPRIVVIVDAVECW